MASIKKSSFHRRGEVHSNSINGTKPSLHNSQLLISSGIASLDNLIGTVTHDFLTTLGYNF